MTHVERAMPDHGSQCWLMVEDTDGVSKGEAGSSVIKTVVKEVKSSLRASAQA